ncbi:n-myristoyl transferase [Anaeramoeba flamelloides]|uniref:Glycylpeptide N-tetradecanoyltransferase n=1 Tax=Anaeramoeba flamelloides TaxID=1746091 RepID=A0ABQ8Z2M5_9EUKA|nr:n-myristoyl transferase [Anaeramoeba flamelloides]
MKPTQRLVTDHKDEKKTKKNDRKVNKNQPFQMKLSKETPLPYNFNFVEIDLRKEDSLDMLLNFLNKNMKVSDNESKWDLYYIKEYLEWEFVTPRYQKKWTVGLQNMITNELVRFICGVEINIEFGSKLLEIAEVSFLILEINHRSKNLSPFLIKEITRRINLKGIFGAINVSNKLLPNPLTKVTCFKLNIKKYLKGLLIQKKSLGNQQKTSLTQDNKCLKEDHRVSLMIHDQKENQSDAIKFQINGNLWEELREESMQSSFNLFNRCTSKFLCKVNFTIQEFRWWFLKRKNVVYTYIKKNPKTNQVTDLFSFYIHFKRSKIDKSLQRTAHSFYNLNSSINMKQLMKDAFIIIDRLGIEKYYCTNIMDNSSFIDSFPFKELLEPLYYYFYNIKTEQILPNQIAYLD